MRRVVRLLHGYSHPVTVKVTDSLTVTAVARLRTFPDRPWGETVEGVKQPLSVVARWLAAGDAGDVEAFDGLLARDVVVHAPRGLSTASLEAEKRVWLDAVAAIPDLRHEVQEVVAQGNVEMARIVVTGTLRHDFAGLEGRGQAFRMDQAVVCHLRDGKVCEAWEIADVGSLVDQMTS